MTLGPWKNDLYNPLDLCDMQKPAVSDASR